MAVKKQTVLPPPIYGTGGQARNYAIEVLEAERALLLCRVKSARAEKNLHQSDLRKLQIKKWVALADKLKYGILLLKSRIKSKEMLEAAEPPAQGVTVQPPPAPTVEAPAAAEPAKDPELPALAGPETKPKVRANCKKFAKCGDYSYTYCFSKCKKREDGTCSLIRGSQAKSKKMAKCNDHSYWYCFTSCDKRRKKKCNLVRTYTRRKK